MSELIRVSICDPSPIIIHGLKNILRADSTVEIVSEASSHAEMLSKCGSVEMDIMLVDVEEKGQSGLRFLRQFRKLLPDVKIIALNDTGSRSLLIEALKLGVRGFQRKHAFTADVLIQTVHTVYNGGTNLSSSAMNALMDKIQLQQLQSKSKLSVRERQVLDLIAVGKSNSDIAANLNISMGTVKSHVSAILAKLKVKNRTAAALNHSEYSRDSVV